MGFLLIILLLFVSLILYLVYNKKEDADKIENNKWRLEELVRFEKLIMKSHEKTENLTQITEKLSTFFFVGFVDYITNDCDETVLIEYLKALKNVLNKNFIFVGTDGINQLLLLAVSQKIESDGFEIYRACKEVGFKSGLCFDACDKNEKSITGKYFFPALNKCLNEFGQSLEHGLLTDEGLSKTND